MQFLCESICPSSELLLHDFGARIGVTLRHICGERGESVALLDSHIEPIGVRRDDKGVAEDGEIDGGCAALHRPRMAGAVLFLVPKGMVPRTLEAKAGMCLCEFFENIRLKRAF